MYKELVILLYVSSRIWPNVLACNCQGLMWYLAMKLGLFWLNWL
ncbi:hypothetical protein F383_16433 [Gossypium arboreum]|uniref:Uncharacterized protein n=1 Tax=Gossypium arboreum TaxID=29729 RepID=A0A0B0PUT6_GOSAR|nr:hypothetical protein F383_16433 [Gossypium arboreum]